MMEDQNEYKNGFPQISVSKDSVLNMLSKVAAFKMEERDLALDKYKRLNDDMEDDEFWLKGKTVIMYLDSASKASNYLGDIAKDMMKIVFPKEESEGGENTTQDDRIALNQLASDMIKEKRLKEQASKKLLYKDSTDNGETSE